MGKIRKKKVIISPQLDILRNLSKSYVMSALKIIHKVKAKVKGLISLRYILPKSRRIREIK